jgi:hypothetical protein
MAKNLLLPSPEYVERIKQHYALFRKTIKGPKHSTFKA